MKTFLVIDAAVNLVLGLLLLLFPVGVIDVLGLPQVQSYFYTSILGAVIFGIGLALGVEIYSSKTGLRGLGLGGAIAINFAGASALLYWLLFGHLVLNWIAIITLWIICLTVFVVGVAELKWKYSKNEPDA